MEKSHWIAVVTLFWYNVLLKKLWNIMTITFAKFVQSRIKLLDEFESMRLN